MSALKYLLVISSLNVSAPDRPAKDNYRDAKRLHTTPSGLQWPALASLPWLVCATRLVLLCRKAIAVIALPWRGEKHE